MTSQNRDLKLVYEFEFDRTKPDQKSWFGIGGFIETYPTKNNIRHGQVRERRAQSLLRSHDTSLTNLALVHLPSFLCHEVHAQ